MSDTSDELDVATQRSPKYPYIALDKALERAERLLTQVRDTAQTREAMARAYGKPATSSATIQTFATLTQYGLLEPVLHGGQRKLRLTQLARNMLHPNAPASVVEQGRKVAALKPPIFQEIWERYGSTAKINDDLVLYYLTNEREQTHGAIFTEKAAQEVLRVYRASLDFAGITGEDHSAPLSEHQEDESEEQASDSSSPDPLKPEPDFLPKTPKVESLATPTQLNSNERELQAGMLSKTASYRVIVQGAVGVKEIEMLIKKLELDKEILADEPGVEVEDLLG